MGFVEQHRGLNRGPIFLAWILRLGDQEASVTHDHIPVPRHIA